MENKTVSVCGVVKGRRVVGEASGEAIAKLEHSTKILAKALNVPLQVQVSSMARWQRSLAPWLMEFTPEHYRSFDRPSVCHVLKKTAQIPELDESPPWVKAFDAFWSTPCTTDASTTSLGSVDVSLRPLDVFLSSAAMVPRTRSGLFFFVLLYFLALARRDAWQRNIIKQDLFNLLYSAANLKEDWAQWPLGLHDPLKVIYRLVVTLNLMVEKNKEVLRSISSLKLFGSSILRAHCKIDSQTTPLFTLLAYCGECGKRPLWVRSLDPALLTSKNRLSFERQEPSPPGNFLCPKCLRLICDDCGFCEETCSLNP